MSYLHPSDEDEDVDDLLVEGCNKDLRALKEACRIYGDDVSDEELSSRYADAAADAGDDEDDDVLLLSIQNRFGVLTEEAFMPAEQALISPSLEEEDDEEILRAVQERFSSTVCNEIKTDKINKSVGRGGGANYKALCSSEQNSTNFCKNNSVEEAPVSEISSDFSPVCDVRLSPDHNPESTGFTFPGQVEVFTDTMEGLSDEPVDGVVYNDDFLADLSNDVHGQSVRSTLDALKKNRLCQRVLTSKVGLLKLKLEENRDLKKRVRALLEFQSVAKRKYAFEEVGTNFAINAFSNETTKGRQQSIWPRMPSEGVKWGKGGPAGNADVAKFKAMQKKYCLTFELRVWTKEERNELVKGVEQQVQENRIRSVMDLYSASSNDAQFLDDQVRAIAENPPTPEDIRAAMPIINWNEVARLYVVGRSPTECWIQWSNYEDRLINHGEWTKSEDKHLWSIVKEHKLCNWDRISQALGSRRSIAQCLVRYQRSLNVGIMRGAWTQEEDEQLRAAVKLYGDQDWSSIAATLECRTGPQCWNRWHKILHPMRQKSGRWNVDEDKRLRLAVSVYGPRMWKSIATHVPGRTEVQCRERWCNVLDPSLILAEWTAEEDQKLETAIAKHGHHRWSTVATELSPRTDNQCWRRWKHLHPELVSAFMKDNKIQKAAIVNNFVGRKKERSKLHPSDFVPEPGAFGIEKEVSKEDDLSNAEYCQNGDQKKRASEKGLTKTRAAKKSRVDNDGELPTVDIMCDVGPEFSKLRRLQRLEKLKQARAAGKLLVWKRPIVLRTDLGVEEQEEPVKQNVKKYNAEGRCNPGRNGTAAFVKVMHELANFCQRSEIRAKDTSKSGTECLDPPNCSGKRNEEDESRTGGNLFSSNTSLTGNGVIESPEKDEEVEAAVKAVLSWPFIWGLQDFWGKVHGGS
eukprot:c20550_g1_i1 orf=872-3616(-)